MAIIASLGIVASPAIAEFVKTSGPLPLKMPGTLGLRVGEDMPAATKKGSSMSCTAAVIEIPNAFARIVTAKHCLGERLLVFDEEHSLAVDTHHEAPGEIDVAFLEAQSPLPFPALPTRSSETLSQGERLCAFRIERVATGISRQQICGRFSGFEAREGGPPTLRLSQPFPRGTSGSPLLDEAGKVVGIVTASQGESGIAEPVEAAFVLTRAPAHPR